MQLFKKQKTFSEVFSTFPESRLNIEHFEKKGDPHSLYISEITAAERPG